jgi:hypothetical protein
MERIHQMERYDSFLVRVWRRSGNHVQQWSGRLEHVQAQIEVRFGDPDSLMAYLRDAIAPMDGVAVDSQDVTSDGGGTAPDILQSDP